MKYILYILLLFGLPLNAQLLKDNGRFVSHNSYLLRMHGSTGMDSTLSTFSTLFNNPINEDILLMSGYLTRYVMIDCGNNDALVFNIFNHADYSSATNVDVPQFSDYYHCKIIGANSLNNVTTSGSWSNGGTGGGYILGYYKYSQATNAYMEATTCDGVTELGSIDIAAENSGVAKVAIDGDLTLANELPTASELVTAGKLANTVLVENGGTLNPTDRIYLENDAGDDAIDKGILWTGTSNRRVRFATELSPGVHTIRVTVTGYMPVGGSSARIQLQGFWNTGGNYDLDGFPNTSQVVNIDTAQFQIDFGANNDFAFNYHPDGSETYEWMGHDDPRVLDSAKLYVDNTLITWTNGSHYSFGDSIVLNVWGHCKHTYTGADHVLDYIERYVFKPQIFLSVNIDFTWIIAGTIEAGYCPMLVTDNNFDSAGFYGGSVYDLSNDNNTWTPYINTSAGYCYNEAGTWAQLVEIPGYELATPYGIGWLDRDISLNSNKLYLRRYTAESVNVNDHFNVIYDYKWKKGIKNYLSK
jgi:hypothetical protein